MMEKSYRLICEKGNNTRITPGKIVRKLKSLNYRLRLAQAIPELERFIIGVYNEHNTDTLCGYKIFVENGHIQQIEKLPDNSKQLEMRFKYRKDERLENQLSDVKLDKQRSYFNGQYHGCSIQLKMERINYSGFTPVYLNSPRDVYLFLRDLENSDRERFLTISMNAKNGVTGVDEISIGNLMASMVHPREVFKSVILRNPAGIILAHNHPSGDPEPSREDISLTKHLVNAGEILGISILDHIIIGYENYTSLKQEGIIR
jgi:hypothetical protein